MSHGLEVLDRLALPVRRPLATQSHPARVIQTTIAMPSSRTNATERMHGVGPGDRGHAFQLTWAPSDHAQTQTISFAPNVTPITFSEPPPLLDIPEESKLFPAHPSQASDTEFKFTPTPRKTAHSKKRSGRGEDHVPRPPNAFILFRSSFIKSQHVSSSIEGNHGTLSKIVGLLWHNLPHEERQSWQVKAKRILEEHKRRFPEYSFKPAPKDKDKDASLSRNGAGTKGDKAGDKEKRRKVRDVEPRDTHRCEVIASLLAAGKKGKELEIAIEEYDRQRKPVIQTRFEAPITARQYQRYRRSSSAPVPDTANSKNETSFMRPENPTHKRKRSSSISRLDIPAATAPKIPRIDTSAQLYPTSPMASGASPTYSMADSYSEYDTSPMSPMTTTSYGLEECNFDFGNFNFGTECLSPASDVCSPLDVPTPTPSSYLTQHSYSNSYDYQVDSFAHPTPAPVPTSIQESAPYLHQPQPHTLSIQTSLDAWSTPSSSAQPLSPDSLGGPGTPDTLVGAQGFGEYGYASGTNVGCNTQGQANGYSAMPLYEQQQQQSPVYDNSQPMSGLAQYDQYDASIYADMPPSIEVPPLSQSLSSSCSSSFNSDYSIATQDVTASSPGQAHGSYQMHFEFPVAVPTKYIQPQLNGQKSLNTNVVGTGVVDTGLGFSYSYSLDFNQLAHPSRDAVDGYEASSAKFNQMQFNLGSGTGVETETRGYTAGGKLSVDFAALAPEVAEALDAVAAY